MSEYAPQPEPTPPSWIEQLNKGIKEGKVIFGAVSRRKHNPLMDMGIGFFNEKGSAGRTPCPIEPLSPQETSLARNDLGMSEQHVEKLSRFSGKRWLNSLGVEYPSEWE